MTVPGSANPLLLRSAAPAAYQIQRSLRFNSSDSAFLSRTPSTAGNRKTWTWAGWVKRSKLAVSDFELFSAGGVDQIRFSDDNGGNSLRIITASGNLITQQLFRDTSSWYHIVVAVDTPQATSADRIKLYINGAQVTAFFSATYPALNADATFNSATAHNLGALSGSYGFFDGYLADIHFIDGQALTPTSFAETNATTGQWVPKAYTGTYGTNGFRLDFSDNSAATATTLGKDRAGSNNWTPSGLSVTAGAGNDSLVDTPSSAGTDTGLGGQVTGNYCTLSAVDNNGGTLSNGNLQKTTSGATNVSGTIAMPSGKWYWEITVDRTVAGGVLGIGAGSAMAGTALSSLSKIYGYAPDGTKYANTTASSYGASYAAGDVIGVKFDADTRQLEFLKNNTSQGVAFTVDSGFTYFPQFHLNNTDITVNFGQRPFAYTAPSGFKALCDQNLPAPTIARPSTVMDVKLYTGNGSTQTISGLGFSPDFVWLKARSAATAHLLFDQIRGATYYLSSNATDAESNSPSNTLTAFTSDGFTLGSNSSANGSSVTLAAWTWDAGTSTVTNTQGSITSQVRANASAGFSIVTYTGTGSAETMGHGLGVAPGLIIQKRRTGTSQNWYVYHSTFTTSEYLNLNTTGAKATISNLWGTINSNVFGFLTDAQDFVAYCFAPVAGYSSFGSYTGNGAQPEGPFIYTGFRPAFLMIKSSSSALDGWFIMDNRRPNSNLVNKYLYANSSAIEADANICDFCANGFKIRYNYAGINQSGATYVWAAWAENPLQYARAR